MPAEIIVQKSQTMAGSFGALSILFFLLLPAHLPAQLTSLRVGTNSPASTESVLLSIATLDDIAKDNPKAKSLTVQQLVDSSFLP